MADFILVVLAAFVAAGIVFGIAVLATGGDAGLAPADPDRIPRSLPKDRPLVEPDLAAVRFGTVLRGYRMAEVDEALRRLGYDIGYKSELIRVMEAELAALRAGELDQADELRRMRMVALGQADPEPAASTADERDDQPAGKEVTELDDHEPVAESTDAAAIGDPARRTDAAAPDPEADVSSEEQPAEVTDESDSEAETPSRDEVAPDEVGSRRR